MSTIATFNNTLQPAAETHFPTKFFKTPSSLTFGTNRSKPLSLRSSTATTTTYKVKPITPEGDEHEFEALDDCYILDSAEDAGVELPYSCRVGACSTCAGQMKLGSVNQSDRLLLPGGCSYQGVA